MKINNKNYKGFNIDIFYNKETNAFSANSIVGSSNCPFSRERLNFCHGYTTPDEAEKDVEIQIDKFLKKVPKTYEELANSIIITYADETPIVDAQALEILVDKFILFKHK